MAKKYDDAWRKRLHKALEEADGNQSEAAKVMGVSQSTVRQVMVRDAALKGRWLDKGAGNIMHRKPQPMSDVVAIQKENQVMAKGLESMGITGHSKAEAMAFLDFGRSSLGVARQLIGGGVVKLFSDLMGDIAQIREEISGGVNDEREKTLREDKSSLIRHVLEAYDRANKAALTEAVVKQKMEERKGGGSRGKPGFSPVTAIQINEPKEVNVTAKERSDSKPNVQD
jgi:predicted transcriptional regulator|tara:strand:+ start:359 stop:1039 length:681 start_codon:yes stop_codon:yes gene_type:complete